MRRKKAEIDIGNITIRFEEGFNIKPLVNEIEKIMYNEKKKRKNIFKRKKRGVKNGKKMASKGYKKTRQG